MTDAASAVSMPPMAAFSGWSRGANPAVSVLHNDLVLTLHRPGFCAVFGANDGNLL